MGSQKGLPEAASWDRPYKIAVNLSPVQFAHADLAELVHEILLETGLPPQPTGARTHRDDARRRQKPHPSYPSANQGARRHDRDRRLRNGILVARHAAFVSVRQDQAGSVVHERGGAQSAGQGDRSRGSRPREEPRHPRACRRRRNGLSAVDPQSGRLRRSAGLSARTPPADRSDISRDAEAADDSSGLLLAGNG